MTALGAMNQPPEMMATRKRAMAADLGADGNQSLFLPLLRILIRFFAFACRFKSRIVDKSLVGNKGYRRYLKVEGSGHFVIDEKTVIRGLDTLQQVEANFQGRRFLFRSQFTAHASQAVRATGVAIPPTLREIQ